MSFTRLLILNAGIISWSSLFYSFKSTSALTHSCISPNIIRIMHIIIQKRWNYGHVIIITYYLEEPNECMWGWWRKPLFIHMSGIPIDSMTSWNNNGFSTFHSIVRTKGGPHSTRFYWFRYIGYELCSTICFVLIGVLTAWLRSVIQSKSV